MVTCLTPSRIRVHGEALRLKPRTKASKAFSGCAAIAGDIANLDDLDDVYKVIAGAKKKLDIVVVNTSFAAMALVRTDLDG